MAAVALLASACGPQSLPRLLDCVRGDPCPLLGESQATPTRFTRVSAGAEHTCAISEAGALVCWGNDEHGEVSAAPTEGSRSWFGAGAAEPFVEVSAGHFKTCALDAAGTIFCWGHESRWASLYPTGRFFELSAKDAIGCAVAREGHVACWWTNSPDLLHGPDDAVFRKVAASFGYVCAIDSEGALRCWGDVPGDVPTLDVPVVDLAAQIGITCLVDADGALSCFGEDADELGLSDVPEGAFVQVDVGIGHACALAELGQAVCWGTDRRGETEVPAGETFAEVSAGASHSCGVRTDGSVLCWGSDSDGRATPPQ